MPWEQRVMKQIKNTVSQHSVKCIIRIKKMPSFCINKRITEAVQPYMVHEKCFSSMKLFCLSGEAVLSWWLLLGASHSALRFACCRSGWRKNCKGRNHLCRWHFKLLFTAVLVQKCSSKCYFKIGKTIVEIFKLLSSVCCGLWGLWKLLLHEWWEKITPLQGRHLFKNNCEFSKEINPC